jgi:hypothetical protein
MQSKTLEQLTPAAAQAILENFPVEAVIEMALAGYLDSEAIGFVDCKPNRGRE